MVRVAAEVANQGADFANLARIETDRRFVEDQDRRIMNDRRGQPDPLAVALGELPADPGA